MYLLFQERELLRQAVDLSMQIGDLLLEFGETAMIGAATLLQIGHSLCRFLEFLIQVRHCYLYSLDPIQQTLLLSLNDGYLLIVSR